MATFTPTFTGTYAGHLIYNVTNYTIGDDFKKYVESMEIVYDPIHKQLSTGFSDIKYQINSTTAAKKTGSIAITLVGDTPHWYMQQLSQLAKAILGSGMEIVFTDSFVSGTEYFCKWENAGDFVENNSVLAGGTILLKFYHVGSFGLVYKEGTYELVYEENTYQLIYKE